MKNNLKFVAMLFAFVCISGCENNGNMELDDPLLEKHHENGTVTMGFNLVFTGVYEYQGPNEGKCGPFPPYFNVINKGEGTGTHFGKVKSHFDFCVDYTNASYPNGFEVAYFEDESGDQLFVYVEGFVLPGRVSGMPSYATSYFKDPFTITGGTGKFEGATGSGYTNDYNSDKDAYSHHHWTGKITLKKKNKLN